jgi:Leucine-rich repeat (LRR) protein
MQHTNAKRTRFGHWGVFIILIFAVTISGNPCPDVCDCLGEEDYILADCSGQDLNKIPENNNITLYYIDLSNNSITEIRKYDLRGYKSIRILNLSNNGISNIDENLFQELVNLKYIYLSENNISSLPPTTFNRNLNLKKLYLKGNPLTLSNHTSISVSDSITYLDISFCNITLLPAGSFVSIPNLVALRLDGNILTNITIETFEPLRKLKEVYMESETSKCAESPFYEFHNYLVKRGINYYGPPVCTDECQSTIPPTLKLTAPVSTAAVPKQTQGALTSVIPRTIPAILETSTPSLKQTSLIFNETNQIANISSETHKPVLQNFSYQTQTHDESTSESLQRNYSSNIAATAINTLAIYVSLLVCIINTVKTTKSTTV